MEKVKTLWTSVKPVWQKLLTLVKENKVKIDAVILALVVIASIGYGQYNGWLYRQPKFHDVIMELGQPLPETEAFLTEYARSFSIILSISFGSSWTIAAFMTPTSRTILVRALVSIPARPTTPFSLKKTSRGPSLLKFEGS